MKESIKKQNKLMISWGGNLLIIVSLVFTAYIFYPVLGQEIRYRFMVKQALDGTVSDDFRIIIPKLAINEKVVANVNPFDKKAYLPVLKEAVAHASGSALPTQPGNVFLFAHSSDNPLSITRYNTAFYLLPKLRVGDEIKLTYQGKTYEYRVREKRIVKPWELTLMMTHDTNQLTLQTCYPIGTDWNRLLVWADPS